MERAWADKLKRSSTLEKQVFCPVFRGKFRGISQVSLQSINQFNMNKIRIQFIL